jgi:hypothetical protein
MVTLNKKAEFVGNTYFADMQVGTLTPSSGVSYKGSNYPLDITFSDSTKDDQSFAASLMMSLSTKKYATQVVLDSCVAAKHCSVSSEFITPYCKNSSSTATYSSQKTYKWSQYFPPKSVIADAVEDTIGFPFITYDQISILKKFDFMGID